MSRFPINYTTTSRDGARGVGQCGRVGAGRSSSGGAVPSGRGATRAMLCDDGERRRFRSGALRGRVAGRRRRTGEQLLR